MYRTAFALLAGAASCGFGQTPTVIQIDIENFAAYYADNPTTASSRVPNKR